MKKVAVLGAMLLAVSFYARTQAQEVVRERQVTLQLDVDAQGRVTAVKIMGAARSTDSHGHEQRPWYPAFPEVLSNAAEKVASTWQFEPPKIAGKPVAGRTFAQAALQIIKQGDGTYRADLKYRRNGPFLDYRVAPAFPMQMKRLGLDAGLVVGALVAPDGSVSDVHVMKIFASASHRGAAFAKAATEAIRRWKGEPIQVDGHAVSSHVRIPMFFDHAPIGDATSNTGEMERLKQQVKEAMLPASMQSTDVGPIRSGDVMALDSPFVKLPSG